MSEHHHPREVSLTLLPRYQQEARLSDKHIFLRYAGHVIDYKTLPR
jgi:hypothetical protein